MIIRRFSMKWRPDMVGARSSQRPAGGTVSLTFCALYVRVGKKQVGNYRYCGGRNQQAA